MKNINLQEHQTVKQMLTEHQIMIIKAITETVLQDSGIAKEDLFLKTKNRNISEARRKIALLSKLIFNVNSRLIGNYLKLDFEWIHKLIKTGYDYLKVDKQYREDVFQLIQKVELETKEIKLNLK